jgi:hypothetical protein
MDILAICRFFALPALIILALTVAGHQKRYGNYVGPKNPIPGQIGHIEIIPRKK